MTFFRLSNVKCLLLTGEVDKSVRSSGQIFSEFNIPKIIKNRLIFDRVIQKIKKVYVLGDTGKTRSPAPSIREMKT